MKTAFLTTFLALVTLGCGPVATSVPKIAGSGLYRSWISTQNWTFADSNNGSVDLDFTNITSGYASVHADGYNCTCVCNSNTGSTTGTIQFTDCGPASSCSQFVNDFGTFTYRIFPGLLRLNLPGSGNYDFQ